MDPSHKTYEVLVRDFQFFPADLDINCGDTLTWLIKDNNSEFSKVYSNQDRYFILYIEGDDIESPMLRKGDKFTHKFENRGNYLISCLNYPRLRQQIDVALFTFEEEKDNTTIDPTSIAQSTVDSEDFDLQDEEQYNLDEDCEYPTENLIEMQAKKEDYSQITECLEKLSKGISRANIIDSFPNLFRRSNRSEISSQNNSNKGGKITPSIGGSRKDTQPCNGDKTIEEDDLSIAYEDVNKVDKMVVSHQNQISKELDVQMEKDLNAGTILDTPVFAQLNQINEISDNNSNSYDILPVDCGIITQSGYTFKNDANTDSIFNCLTNQQKMMCPQGLDIEKSNCFLGVDNFFQYCKKVDNNGKIDEIRGYNKHTLVEKILEKGKLVLSSKEKTALEIMEERFFAANFLQEVGDLSDEPDDKSFMVDTDNDDSHNSSRLLDELSDLSISRSGI